MEFDEPRRSAPTLDEALSAAPVAHKPASDMQDHAAEDAEAVMTHHCLTPELNRPAKRVRLE